ncbi:uncharacterized protein TNCV_3514051 [Trichonephila clavipes]|nr:uncharacterized protein TNCV_3514051 [Trichonephila clavipes]
MERVVEDFSLISQQMEDLEKKLLAEMRTKAILCLCLPSQNLYLLLHQCHGLPLQGQGNCRPMTEKRTGRGEAAEVLQTLPDTERLNLNYLYNALGLRFGQKYCKNYTRLQKKTRLQKTRESLQEYASEVERLANLAFTDHPATVSEVISLQYFVNGLNNEEIQKTVRMADVQDLKSALKLEVANEASFKDRHSIRGARVTADATCEYPWMKKLNEEIQDL